MTELRFVALDLSLAATGVAFTHDHTGAAGIGVRTVHTARTAHGSTDMDHRRVATVLADVAAACLSRPHLVVIEWLPLIDGKGDVTVRLGELHGVIKHWLFTRRPPIVYTGMRPQDVKIWATGKGNATKTAVREAVTAQYGRLCHIEDDNQSDSLSMLSAAAAAYGQPLASGITQLQRRALAGVRWPTLQTEAGPVVPVASAGAGGAAGEGRRPSRPRAGDDR